MWEHTIIIFVSFKRFTNTKNAKNAQILQKEDNIVSKCPVVMWSLQPGTIITQCGDQQGTYGYNMTECFAFKSNM